MANNLGTQANLTGIPSLLLSGLQQVQDPTTQTALYQIQNWGNSFFVWQYGHPSGSYVTGGVTIDFDAPYANEIFAITFGPQGGAGLSQVSITGFSLASFTVQCFLSNGTQVANGSPYQFFYMAIGH